MNETITVLQNHASHRHYVKGHQLPQEELTAILQAAQQAPSWQNGQHYSIVVVDDQNIKETFYQSSSRNPQIESCSIFLVFCLDFSTHKLAAQKHGVTFDVSNDPETLIIATMDTALAMQNAIVAAESLGYGTVAIGGVRQMPEVVIETLKLPKYVVPVCGLCIGVVDSTKEVERVKPRFSKDTKIHYNVYKPVTMQSIDAYEVRLAEFAESREIMSWSEKFANNYSKPVNEKTKVILKQQGV